MLDILSLAALFIGSLSLLIAGKKGPNEKVMAKHEKKTGAPMTQEEIESAKARSKKFGIISMILTIGFAIWCIALAI